MALSRRRGLAALLALLLLSGCGRIMPEDAEDTLDIYASFYPINALTELVTKDVPGVTVHCLVQPQDGCLRAYALSDWDGYLLAYAADAVVLGGRGLEQFEARLYEMGEQGPAVIAAFTDAKLYNEGGKESSETESHWEGANPHLYMSPEGAAQAARVIAKSLAELDPDHAQAYAENLERAETRLAELATGMRETAQDAAGSPVFLLNEALAYTALALGLEIKGWYPRESGAELSDNELAACLEALSASEARVVLIEKQAPTALAEALTEAGYAVARIDILSGGRESLGIEGYFSAQQANAQAVAEAFADQMENR